MRTNQWRVRGMARVLTLPALVGLVAAAAAERAPEVAMVTDVSGACEVASGGSKVACELFQNLASGDQVELGAGARLVVTYFAPAREFTLAGPVSGSIGQQEPRIKGKAARQRSLGAALDGEALRDWSRQREVLGGVVMRGGGEHKIRLLKPAGKTLDRPEVFSWNASEVAADQRLQFRFVLSDRYGQQVLETLVDEAQLRLPPELPLYSGEPYSWEVSTRLASGVSYSSVGSFEIVEDEVRGKVEAARPGRKASFADRVRFAATLQAFDLRQLAREHWAALAAERPDLELLGELARSPD